MSIVVTKLNLVKKPPFVGYFNIYIEKWGVDINTLTLFEKDGRYYFNMPCQEYVNTQGETKYAPYFTFRNDKHREGFKREVLKAVDEYLNKKIK